MSEKLKGVTIEAAFKTSLLKWERVKLFSNDLFTEIDRNCGFCEYTRSLSETELRKNCDECPVQTRCDKITDALPEMQEKINELINSAISFLKKGELEK